MDEDSTDQDFVSTAPEDTQPRAPVGQRDGGAQVRYRPPSTAGYMATAAALASVLFFLLWWLLHSNGVETPWVPAGLAASVVMLIAFASREVVVRRAVTRHILEQEKRDYRVSDMRKRSGANGSGGRMHGRNGSGDKITSSLRALQKLSAELDTGNAPPAAHLELFEHCKEYLERSEEALRSVRTGVQGVAVLRAGQERVRSLQKHHLLNWAAGESRLLVTDANRRATVSDKVATATRAIEIIDHALKLYPAEPELLASAGAVREYISSVKVAHWVELAERAAFKGQFKRAIDRYRDALFYLSRESMKDDLRDAMAERIALEVEALRTRLKGEHASSRRRGISSDGNGAVTDSD